MVYLALGDSVSIDLYTEVDGGGAASQLARLLKADSFIDRTYDGATSEGVIVRQLSQIDGPKPGVITLTVGGNDLLGGFFHRTAGDRAHGGPASVERLFENLFVIADGLELMACPVVINTIYDPTDGDDRKVGELGLVPEARLALEATNRFIAQLARERGFLLCDLEALFRGHGYWSDDPWLVMHIEPNLEGATQIAKAWYGLLKTL